jgi:hypothetical protein
MIYVTLTQRVTPGSWLVESLMAMHTFICNRMLAGDAWLSAEFEREAMSALNGSAVPSPLPENSSNRHNPGERLWCDRQPFLAERGYTLRSRYRPGWKPSWVGTTINPAYCEDSIRQIVCSF